MYASLRRVDGGDRLPFGPARQNALFAARFGVRPDAALPPLASFALHSRPCTRFAGDITSRRRTWKVNTPGEPPSAQQPRQRRILVGAIPALFSPRPACGHQPCRPAGVVHEGTLDPVHDAQSWRHDVEASALTRIDPLLLMETDPAGAHEFVVRWPDRPVAGVVGGKFSLA